MDGQLSYATKAKYKQMVGPGIGLIVFGLGMVVMVVLAFPHSMG